LLRFESARQTIAAGFTGFRNHEAAQ
jgi:hypothetical protein